MSPVPIHYRDEKHNLRYALVEDWKTTLNLSSKNQCLTLSEFSCDGLGRISYQMHNWSKDAGEPCNRLPYEP